jgi:hypothetical protein
MSDDRTKPDKAWEARQEAARYRIFNAATKAAEATDEADDDNYFAALDQAGTRPKLLPRDCRIQDLRQPVRGVGHTLQTVLARRAVEYGGIRYTLRARIEREQWSVAIHPAGLEMKGRVVIGSRSDAELRARHDKRLAEKALRAKTKF